MSKLKELEKRLRDEPENLGLRVMVAGALREAGRQQDAVELYRSVAIAYRDQGRSQQAIAVCRSILEIAPDDPSCHALLAALVVHHKGRSGRDTGQVYGNEIVLEVGTPPPAAERSAPVQGEPRPRRSSFDETPLPGPLPYHVADPTTRSLKKLSEADLGMPVSEGAKTRPGPTWRGRDSLGAPGIDGGTSPGVEGIASAARQISASLVSGRAPEHGDMSAELDTRRRRRIESSDLRKITLPPPTAPIERYDLVDEDAQTPQPHETFRMRGGDRDADTEQEDEDDGIPTLSDEDLDEPTRPRDQPLEVMLRAESEGPLASPFFAPLPADRRGQVLMRFHRKVVRAGTTVIRQGETGHALVLVERGQLEVRIERASGMPYQLTPIVAGDYVGEAALLSRTPAPAQVVAATDCELLLLTARDFYEIAGAFPALWADLKDVAERRTREVEARLKR
ncbi:MAG: cyclic nucleotide-binding domain-containing protein [Deltaproteobacteria bacterium]|nr:cyclic nucleotide-binding domain-containing protein [Deltaproteobacteria bacterium]MDQ3364087.1 cyclic nucleotide-binding domain-containing protein [Myxococcota bacterium]